MSDFRKFEITYINLELCLVMLIGRRQLQPMMTGRRHVLLCPMGLPKLERMFISIFLMKILLIKLISRTHYQERAKTRVNVSPITVGPTSRCHRNTILYMRLDTN